MKELLERAWFQIVTNQVNIGIEEQDFNMYCHYW